MTLGWKSTINNAFITPTSLPSALEQTIPSLIRDEIQRVANLSLFQKSVLSSDVNYSQVPVDMKVIENSLNIRISKNGSWIPLLSSNIPLSPEEKAIDAIRQNVMEKIALLWAGTSNNHPTESDSERSPFDSSSRRDYKGNKRTRSKRSRRSDEKSKKQGDHKKFSTIISRNRIDCSTHTTNNYYCSLGSHNKPSHTNKRGQNSQNPTVDANTQTDPYSIFRQPNIFRNENETDSSNEDTKHSSTNSFSNEQQMKDNLSSSSDTGEVENSLEDEFKHSSTNSFSDKSLKNNFSLKNIVIDRSCDSSSDESEHSSTSYFSVASKIPIDSDINDEESYFSCHHAIHDESDQIDSFSIKNPDFFSKVSYTEAIPTSYSTPIDTSFTIPKNVEIFPENIFKEETLDSEAEEGFVVIPSFAELTEEIQYNPPVKTSSENPLDKDFEILTAETVKIFPKNVSSEETLNSEAEDDFVMLPPSSELTEEMQCTPPVKTSIKKQIQQIWKNRKNITLFKAKPRKINNSPENAVIEPYFEKHFDKDFEISTPIINNLRNVEINETSKNIEQIKRDLGRVKIRINDFQCLNIKDFVNHLGLTLNSEETDIAATDSPIIPKILYFAHQGLFRNGFKEIWEKITTLSNNSLRPSQMDTFTTIDIYWNPEFPEQTEIVGEVLYQLKYVREEPNLVPNSIHLLRIKNSFYRQEEEITFKKLSQEKDADLEDDFEIIDLIKEPEGELTTEPFELDSKVMDPLDIRNELATKFQERFNREKVNNPPTINPLNLSEGEKVNDSPAEDTQKSIENEILEDYEFVQSSDIEKMPLLPAPTFSTKHSTPIFLSPKNPFHLEKYSHLLRVIKENFSKFSSDSQLTSLKGILDQDNLDSRKKYRRYVDELRKLLRNTTIERKTRANLEELCYTEFTMNVMTNFIEQFLREATNNTLKRQSELTMHTIADAIIATNNQLKNSPAKKELIALYSQKISGELGINFDPTKYSNIPDVRSIHTVKSSSKNEPYEIIYMRHGTPTVETGIINPPKPSDNFLNYCLRQVGGSVFKNYYANTIPEYDAFLNRARDLNTPIFYVNHQNMVNKTSSEYSRSKAIQNHEITHPDHFFFITLPLDGVVLNHVENTDQWKKGLIDNLMNQKNGFRLPAKLKNDFYKEKQILKDQFKDLLDQIHHLYFGNQPLNHRDQQVLLMIFYSYLKDFIKEKYQIQLMVSACKDNKDRGNTSSSIDEALYNLRLGRENDSHALYDLYIRFFAPFIIKYEHIVPHRFKPLIDVLQHISTLTDIQKQSIRQFKINNFEILDQKVPH